jgi:hypothetical protein
MDLGPAESVKNFWFMRRTPLASTASGLLCAAVMAFCSSAESCYVCIRRAKFKVQSAFEMGPYQAQAIRIDILTERGWNDTMKELIRSQISTVIV